MKSIYLQDGLLRFFYHCAINKEVQRMITEWTKRYEKFSSIEELFYMTTTAFIFILNTEKGLPIDFILKEIKKAYNI